MSRNLKHITGFRNSTEMKQRLDIVLELLLKIILKKLFRMKERVIRDKERNLTDIENRGRMFNTPLIRLSEGANK